jgi:hypothetical protein
MFDDGIEVLVERAFPVDLRVLIEVSPRRPFADFLADLVLEATWADATRALVRHNQLAHRSLRNNVRRPCLGCPDRVKTAHMAATSIVCGAMNDFSWILISSDNRVTYGTSILTVRSRSASMNSFFCSGRYSGPLVWPRITSSMSVWANFLGLILCSCDAPSRS